MLEPGALACAQCGAALPAAAPEASKPHADATAAPRQTTPSPSPAFRFSLLGLMGLVTVIALALGIGLAVPGLGIALGILATPALIRVSLAMSRRRAAGLPVTAEMRIIAFFRSLGLMLIVSIAASIAFVIVCFPVGVMALDSRGGTGILFAFIMGIGAGLATVVFLLVKFGPLKRYERLYPWADPDAPLGEPWRKYPQPIEPLPPPLTIGPPPAPSSPAAEYPGEPWRKYPQPTKLPPPPTMEPPPTPPSVPPERPAPPAPPPPEPERKNDATS